MTIVDSTLRWELRLSIATIESAILSHGSA
ncbi:hypothetical protein Vi05172_g11827 [Venturia inaequalis]|nr:hypothetical protein Vi05172_g11827 [Venturia inaequalis]